MRPVRSCLEGPCARSAGMELSDNSESLCCRHWQLPRFSGSRESEVVKEAQSWSQPRHVAIFPVGTTDAMRLVCAGFCAVARRIGLSGMARLPRVVVETGRSPRTPKKDYRTFSRARKTALSFRKCHV